MNILHLSDLHGGIRVLVDARQRIQSGHWPTPDVVVFSGDMLPNTTRGEVAREVPYQRLWLADYAPIFERLLGGVPLLSTPGNHDYVDVADFLAARGYPAHSLVSADGSPRCVEIAGERFVGLREIPYIAGEWAGEVHDLRGPTEAAFALDPTVLVPHCPPSGVLDGCHDGHVGNPVLASLLAYRPHAVRDVLCGHVHEHGGESAVFDGSSGLVRVVNSATTCALVTPDRVFARHTLGHT